MALQAVQMALAVTAMEIWGAEVSLIKQTFYGRFEIGTDRNVRICLEIAAH
jgi:hypothetical protein